MTSGWARSPVSPLGVRWNVTRSSHSALRALTRWRYSCDVPWWPAAARPAAMAVSASRASRDQRHGAHLGGVEPVDVDPDERHVRVLERGPGGRDEVAHPGADADDEVGVPGQPVGREAARRPDRADVLRVVPGQRALAGLRLAHRDPVRRRKVVQRRLGAGVDRTAPGDDERAPRGPDELDDLVHELRLGARPADPPDPPLEEPLGPVVDLGLDVLGQGDRHGAGLGRVGEDAERLGQAGDELLGARDAVEVAGDRAEGVRGGDVVLDGVLDLLEHRVHEPVGEVVGREQQHRQPVDGRRRGARDHVRRAGPDGAGAGERLHAVLVLGEGRREMHLGLLVLRPVVRHLVLVAQLLERLPEARDVAVAEDPPDAGDEPVLLSVPLDVLLRQEADDGLPHRQPNRAQLIAPLALESRTPGPAVAAS